MLFSNFAFTFLCVTVPNLSEHLSNAATTAQLSARFSYAATMKSLNNLLLLGDGETWTRQRIDFAGLPEMVRTFLQVAADIPVMRSGEPWRGVVVFYPRAANGIPARLALDRRGISGKDEMR